jgi:hypothetical protein
VPLPGDIELDDFGHPKLVDRPGGLEGHLARSILKRLFPLTCAICRDLPAIAIVTVGATNARPMCRRCGLETQRQAEQLGTQVDIEEVPS